jgi:hypothetical protein
MATGTARRSLTSALALVLGVAALLPVDAHAASTYQEQQGSRGSNTFTNYHNASGMGPRVEPGAWVEVSCKVHDPYIESVNPDGYWYRLASSPWNDQYYAPANTFMNGDPWGGPYTHNTDFNVPDCGSEGAPSEPPPRTPSVSLERGSTAESGYWYAISLRDFDPGTTVDVSCRDSKDPDGFRSFSLRVDSSGNAATSAQCFSGDGPDHWVVANGTIESNHVVWSGPAPAASPGGAPPTPGSTTPNGNPPGNGQTGSTTTQGGTARGNGSCSRPSGEFIPSNGRVWYALYDHYMWGNGADTVVDWSFFVGNPDFVSFARGLNVNQARQFTPSPRYPDMWLALRTFTVRRESDQCYTINDHYDFTPTTLKQALENTTWLPTGNRQGTINPIKLLTDVVYLPEWAYQLSGAQEFRVLGGGRL